MFILSSGARNGEVGRFVFLRCCECNHIVPIYSDECEKVAEKYAILKEGVEVTCNQCGSTQPEEARYLPLEPQTVNIPVPKCPTCGSSNVEKISTAKKAIGFATVGVFSSNFGKTMHCKQCGYKW